MEMCYNVCIDTTIRAVAREYKISLGQWPTEKRPPSMGKDVFCRGYAMFSILLNSNFIKIWQRKPLPT